MNKLKNLFIALRPWSFSASLTPVLLGSVLAYKRQEESFQFLALLLTLIITLCVHGAGNLVNTYYDYKYGIDNEDTVSDRTLVDKLLKPEDITRFGVALYFFGSVSFIVLLFISPAKDEVLAFLYFGGLSLSFMYTGGIGFKYLALGDLIIIITFGPVSVLFAYIAQIGLLTENNFYEAILRPLLYAMPLVLNTEAIVHCNNVRDLKEDKKSGIFTLAIHLGYTKSYILYVLLLFVPYFIFLSMAIKYDSFYFLPLITILMAFDLEKDFRYSRLACLPIRTAKLNLLFGLLYVLACFLAD